MMAIAMTLSAFAVYQATRAADAADAALTQARASEAQVTRLSGELQTLIANDSAVLAQLCSGSVERDAARASLLSRSPDIETLVTSTIELDALRPLVRGDRLAGCVGTAGAAAPYRVGQALVGLENQTSLSALTARAAQLRSEASALGAQEQVLITLGLVFIGVLAGLIVVDQLADRRGRPSRVGGSSVVAWRAGAVISCAVVVVGATVVLLIAAVDRIVTAAVVVALGAAALSLWLWARSRHALPGRTERPRWWAEILGAVAVVAFASAAVALSVVSVNDRDATARADALLAEAERLQEDGIQRIARGLSSLTSYAEAEAAAVAAAQLAVISPDSEIDPAAAAAYREEVDNRLTVLEDGLREQFEDGHSDGAELCSFIPPAELETSGRPSELYYELSDQAYIPWYVSRSQWTARACDTAAELTRQEMTVWSEHKSLLTVALVVLGLSGFMLGLASGRSRTRRSSVILLVVGTAGIITGAGLTMTTIPDAAWRQNIASAEEVDALAQAVATAQTDCTADPAPLIRALEAYDHFGPAHEWLGYALWCAAEVTDGWTILSAEMDEELLSDAVDELVRAHELGGDTARLQGNLGFAQISLGIVRDEPLLVRAGLERTERALALLERESGAGGVALHSTRLNRALGLAALGLHAEAADAYAEAGDCLTGAREMCSAQALSDPAVLTDVRSWGLADLELLAGEIAEERLDEYRWSVIGAPYSTVFGLEGAVLDVYPQELQVAAHGDQPAVTGSAAVVWYHRADEDGRWAVVAAPTAATIGVGPHLQHVVVADMLLPSGLYRADVYANGVRTEVHLAERHEAREDLARYESRRLGISVVVPADWYEWQDDGVVWHLGPTGDSGLVVRRVEHVDTPEDVDGFVADELEQALSAFRIEGTPDRAHGQWFRELQNTVTVEYAMPDGSSRAKGIAGLRGYVDGTGCGAALFAAGMGGEGVDPEDLGLLTELAITRPAPRVEPIRGRIVADTFAIVVPVGWDAALRPPGAGGSLFSAKDCSTWEANLLLSQEEAGDGLRQYVDGTLAQYADPEEFPGFELFERAQVEVPGAEDAEVLVFSWDSDGDGSADDQVQYQMFGVRDGTVTVLTVTVSSDAVDRYRQDVSEILTSLRLRGTGG